MFRRLFSKLIFGMSSSCRKAAGRSCSILRNGSFFIMALAQPVWMQIHRQLFLRVYQIMEPVSDSVVLQTQLL